MWRQSLYKMLLHIRVVQFVFVLLVPEVKSCIINFHAERKKDLLLSLVKSPNISSRLVG